MSLRNQLEREVPTSSTAAGGRPILLATFGTPIAEEAAAVAIDAAVESGAPLIVANITRLEALPLSVMMGYDALEELTPDVSGSVRRLAQLAAGFGLAVQQLRIRSPRPVSALVELVTEREPGLVVFGPDCGRVPKRLYRRAVEALRRDVHCLVWLPG